MVYRVIEVAIWNALIRLIIGWDDYSFMNLIGRGDGFQMFPSES
jgi:hypothetical protein